MKQIKIEVNLVNGVITFDPGIYSNLCAYDFIVNILPELARMYEIFSAVADGYTKDA